MQPIAVHHVSVNVPDVDAAIAFYTGVLGGSLRADRPDFGFGGAWIDLGAQQLHLIEAEAPPNLGQHFAVQVEHLDEVIGELRSKGITVGEPRPVGPSRQTFLEDPAGNVVELHEVSMEASR